MSDDWRARVRAKEYARVAVAGGLSAAFFCGGLDGASVEGLGLGIQGCVGRRLPNNTVRGLASLPLTFHAP